MFSKTDIEKYFIAEKQESLLFLVIGIVALVLAIAFFFFLKTNFYKGAAIPLIVIGLVQIASGYTLYKRSDEDRVRNVYAHDMNPDQLKNEELPRMKVVNRNFIIYRWIEISCVLAAALLIFFYKSNPGKTFWYGVGVTLAIQAALMLGADYFAEKRANIYSKGLESLFEKN